ncbi:hypothetical protein LOD99_13459 [Oopsacas minuta]|uniref:Large ribosomal subunit protein uL10m n=1 Tax=Oopsacas minuta TaxID=111878 RepID=A0AAV7KRD4_9METZ|nr:hypothetical protein LOD99_13459 [Oopsacas minuta]
MNLFRHAIKLSIPSIIRKRLFSLVSCSKNRTKPFLISKSSYTIKEILMAKRLQKTLDENSIVAFYHYHDKSSDVWAELRREMSNEGAVYENTLLGNEQLIALSRLPDKEMLQGQILGILNQGGNQLRALLRQNQYILVNYLTQIFEKEYALKIT